MKERGFGRSVQIASASRVQSEPDICVYDAVKAATINLSVSLARSLARTGITVATVTPGTIQTPAMERCLDVVAGQQNWVGDCATIDERFTPDYIPLCTDLLGRPEGIGLVVALIASPLSCYITGASYCVNRGQCRSVN